VPTAPTTSAAPSKVEIRYREHVWLEELIEWVEDCGSAPVFALLKREDEKALTEQAYAKPMFVEDVFAP